MTIEIREPELEQRIQQLMSSGEYASVEDLLRQSLRTAPTSDGVTGAEKQSLGDFLRNSPLWNSGLQIERSKDGPRVPEF